MIYRTLLYSRSSYYVLRSFKLHLATCNLLLMEKTTFCILLCLVFLASLCNSQDYEYDDYDEYYDYNNQKPEDYNDDYSQDLNDYYDQNLLAPPNPPLPPPPPPMGKTILFLL